jgi:hypothetical protein
VACTGVWASAAASLAVGAVSATSRAALLAGLFLQAGVQVQRAPARCAVHCLPLFVMTCLFYHWCHEQLHACGAMASSEQPLECQTQRRHESTPTTATSSGFFQAYVVLGIALSGPGAAWVLTCQRQALPPATQQPQQQQPGQRLPAALQLWDPLTGRSSGAADSSCALREVLELRGSSACLWNAHVVN